MDIAIIGAGFTGLSAGLRLAQRGHRVSIFEAHTGPGGLAGGFRKDNWNWPLEYYYHHFFTSDHFALNLAKEVGIKTNFYTPKTSTYLNGNIYQLDSPKSLFNFPHLSFINRLRTGTVIFFLKLNPFWKILESSTSEEFIRKTMGEQTWRVLWKPLFYGKFGKLAEEIPAYWFWTRIHKRSRKLGYPEGGYLTLAEKLAEKIIKKRGKIFYETCVVKVLENKDKFVIKYENSGKAESQKFDFLISTIPFKTFDKIFPGLPEKYKKKFLMVRELGVINVVIRLKKPFLPDKTYWLNINDLSYPFVAVVEHTNFINKKNYGGEHLLYVGKYLPATDKQFWLDKKKLVSLYKKYLKKINPGFEKNIIGVEVFKTPYAQPVFPKNYSKHLPDVVSPVPRLFIATMQQVYPWDRGTNYAIAMGEKVANLI